MVNVVEEVTREASNEQLVRAAVLKNRLLERALALIANCKQLLDMNLSNRSRKKVLDVLIGYTKFESPTLSHEGMPTVEELEDFIGKLKEQGKKLDVQENMVERIKKRAQKALVTTS